MKALGRYQGEVLEALGQYDCWFAGCGWNVGGDKRTGETLERLVKLGYVDRRDAVSTGQGTYRLNETEYTVRKGGLERHRANVARDAVALPPRKDPAKPGTIGGRVEKLAQELWQDANGMLIAEFLVLRMAFPDGDDRGKYVQIDGDSLHVTPGAVLHRKQQGAFYKAFLAEIDANKGD